jgi:UPF0755 protein
MKKTLIFFLLLIILVFFTGYAFVFPLPWEESHPVEIVIEPGESFLDLTDLLVEKGVVKNGWYFRYLARNYGVDRKIQAGRYRLKTSMDYRQALKVLTSRPEKGLYRVVIPEGFTVSQIAERMAKEAKVSRRDFLSLALTGAANFQHSFLDTNLTPSLEGYLFPKTYLVWEGSEAKEVVKLMLDQFAKELKKLDLDKLSNRGLTLHKLVTIASMIEKEAKLPSERRLISAVIYNRLSRGMRLQIDATVLYALGYHKKRLFQRDTMVNSPYNTYLYPGLPPGPICNPGLDSLKAALEPAPVDYLYYVLSDPKTGRHTFTRTEAEFLKAKEEAKKRW